MTIGPRLAALCSAYLREPVSMTLDGTGTVVSTFEPPLTVQEQAAYDDLSTMAKFGLSNDLTLAEFRVIKPDLVTARNFVGIASPTAAQSNAALKATIRVLGALLRA